MLLKAIDEYWLGRCVGLPSSIDGLSELLGVEETQVSSMLRNTQAHSVEEDHLHFPKIRNNYLKAQEMSSKQSARAKTRFSKTTAALPRHSHPYPYPDPDPDPDPDSATCSKKADINDDWIST